MRIGVVGAMGVGKTTVIKAARNYVPPDTKFIEMRCWGATAAPRVVDACVIVVEKSRYSMLWLERTILQFRAVPTIIIQMIYPLPSASTDEELAPFLDIIKKYNVNMFPIDYDNINIIARVLVKIGLSM
jgi:ABC-type glutathione transport system ATPase component